MKNLIQTASRKIIPALVAALAGITLLLACAWNASASSDTWNGTASTAWPLSGNWSTSPATVPGTGDTAIFNNAGNGNTTLDLGGGVTISNILFDTSSAAAYTIGSGAVGSQTLTLNNGSPAITLNPDVANNQLFNANLVLGTAIASTTTFSNSSASTLTIAGSIKGGTGGTAGVKTLVLAGSGPIALGGGVANGGATSLALTKTGGGTATLSAVNTNTGTTTVSGGTLVVAPGAGISPASVGAAMNIGTISTVPAVMTNAGSLNVNGFTLGNGADQNGTFGMGGGSMTVNGAARVGSETAGTGANPGNGTFNLTGGTVTALSYWQIGRFGGVGTMNMSGGNFIQGSSQYFAIGSGNNGGIGGVGTFNMSGGNFTTSNYFAVANGGANGTFNMSGGNLFATNASGQILVGYAASAVTTLGSSVGEWNLSGTANVVCGGASNKRLVVGLGGTGTLNQSNGALTFVAGATQVELGAAANGFPGTGVWRMSGGTAAIATPLWLGDGAGCTGTLTLSDTAAMTVASIAFGTNSATASGTLNLDGGILTVNNSILKMAGSGTFNFNGGKLVSGGSSTAFLTGLTAANVLAGGAIIDTANNSITISQNLLDGDGAGGGLTKLGTGTLLLNGTHTYTGPTLVNGGVLGGECAIPGSVTVATSCGLAPGSSTIGTMSAASLALNGTTTNRYKFNSTTNDLIVVSGGLTLGASTRFSLYEEGTGLPYSALGTFTLIQYGGVDPVLDATWTTASAANPHIANPSSGFVYRFAASGGSLTLTITSTLNIGHWGVDSDGNWSVAGNWTGLEGTMPPRNPSDSAIFGTGTSLRTVTLDANETVGAITFENANSFVIAGGNTLTLDKGGNGATINVTDGSANRIQSPLALKENTFITVNTNKALTIAGSIANVGGTRTLLVAGAGTLALSGANTYGPAAGAVGTTITGDGILQLGSSTALGAGDVTNSSSYSIQSAASNVTVPNNFGLGQALLVGNNGNSNLTFAGVISGGGSLTKVGDNVVTLGATNTYSGNTTVSAGTLNVAAGATIVPPTSATLWVGSVSNVLGVMTNSGTIDANASVNGFWVGYGSDTLGIFNMAGGSLAVNGASRIGSEPASPFGINPGNGTFNLSGGTVTSGNYWQVGRNLGVGTMNMTGGVFIKTANNYFVVGNSGANGTFNMSGGTLIATGQVLVAYSATAPGPAVGGSVGVWNLSGSANVDIRGTSRFAIGLGGDGTLNQTGGTLTYTNTAAAEIGAFSTFAGTGLWNMSGGTAVLTNRLVIGDGSGSVGTLTLSGPAAMSVGGIQLGLSSGTGTLNLDGGTLTVNGTITNDTGSGIFNFNGGTLKAGISSTMFMTNVTAAVVQSGGAIIDTEANTIAIDQPLLDGGGGLVKLGSGALTLSGVSTYSGATTVSNGTLLVDGSVAGPVTVKPGATLGGNGSVAGVVTVEANGVIGAGTGIGTLTLGGSPVLGGTVVAELDRNGGAFTNDLIDAGSNPLAYGGTLVLTNTGAALQVHDTFKLFNTSGGYSGSFALTSLTPGQVVTWDTANLTVDGTVKVAAISSLLPTTPTNFTFNATGNQLSVSWPSNYTGWLLESNSVSLSSTGAWATVIGSSTTNQVMMTLDPSETNVFFRMRLP